MHMVSAENKVCFIDLHNLRDTLCVRLPPSFVLPCTSLSSNIDEHSTSTSTITDSVRFCVSDELANLFVLIEENAIAHLNTVNMDHPIRIGNGVRRKDSIHRNVITARCVQDMNVYDSFNNPIEFDVNNIYNTFIEPILAIRGLSFTFGEGSKPLCITFDYQLVQVRICTITIPTIPDDVKHINLFQLKD